MLRVGWLRVSQVVDGQQTDERQPFSFNLTLSILFLSIYDHQGMSYDQAGTSGSRNSLEKRPSACEHIIHDHGSIPWLERPSLFALKLNAPPALLHDFLRAFYRAGYAGPAFGFPFPHDGIGSAAFLLHEGEGVIAKR